MKRKQGREWTQRKEREKMDVGIGVMPYQIVIGLSLQTPLYQILRLEEKGSHSRACNWITLFPRVIFNLVPSNLYFEITWKKLNLTVWMWLFSYYSFCFNQRSRLREQGIFHDRDQWGLKIIDLTLPCNKLGQGLQRVGCSPRFCLKLHRNKLEIQIMENVNCFSAFSSNLNANLLRICCWWKLHRATPQNHLRTDRDVLTALCIQISQADSQTLVIQANTLTNGTYVVSRVLKPPLMWGAGRRKENGETDF